MAGSEVSFSKNLSAVKRLNKVFTEFKDKIFTLESPQSLNYRKEEAVQKVEGKRNRGQNKRRNI